MAIKETVKNLFGKVLKIGTPPEKEVLYKEVIKRKVPKESPEKIFVEDIKQSFKKVLFLKKSPQDSEKKQEGSPSVAKKKKPTGKKTTTAKKKITTKETNEKKTTAKKASAKTTTKKTTSKKATEKKTKTTTSSASSKKSTATAVKTVNDKKSSTKKTVAKKKPAKKETAPKPSKRDEKIALYTKDVKKHYGEVDEAFLALIVKNLGPSIYRKDAELVSCSDPKELDTVRRNFLKKKLGIDAGNNVLDAAIQDVCTELKGVRKKYRATFYYALAKKFKKESALS